ncbi:MAG: XRE family transcriptional regulator [Clostridia bacterium]
MDKNKLKSKMILNGDTGSDLAEYLSISRTTLSSKMNNNGSEFTQGEILKIKEKYKLTGKEIDEIFFNDKVS